MVEEVFTRVADVKKKHDFLCVLWTTVNGNPLQCSCLENPRDGGAWWAAVYGVAQSWTWLKRLSSSSSSSKDPSLKPFFPDPAFALTCVCRGTPPQHGYLFPFVSEGLFLCASMCFIQNICLIFPLSQSSFSFSIPSFSFSSSFFSASLHLSFLLKKIFIGCLDTQDLHCILSGRSRLGHGDSLVVARV